MVGTRRGSRKRHGTALASAIAAAIALALLASPGVAPAAPGTAGTDDEGGTVALRQALDEANRGYLDAQAVLDQSRSRQAKLIEELRLAQERHAVLAAVAAQISNTAYRAGGLATASALLNSASPDAFLDRATTIKLIAVQHDRQLRDLAATSQELTSARTSIDGEIVTQQAQFDVMAKKKQDAERALQVAGGGRPTTGIAGKSLTPAKPAARTANGKWPNEGCSEPDPTTGGCITPRTRHALQQVKAIGFTRHASCHRSGGGGEHPKGRACDFAVDTGGFGGVATGGDRVYGDNLAKYLVENATALGVLYVIWFRKVWQPAGGWSTYSGGNGDPSSDHTNHVHLSVY